MPRLWALALLALGLAACGRSRGSAPAGAPCRSDFDCAAGFCAGPSGNRRCAATCSRDQDCPEGWSCHGVTRSGIVVCAEGDAVPMPRWSRGMRWPRPARP